MGAHKFAGFTIIETMLFFAISGILIISLIVGVGASLNTQRYRDATESFKSLLQQQYSDITNVQNGRDDNWSCGSGANPVAGGATSDNRGQSNCMLLGKYVHLQDDKISVFKVVGYQRSNSRQSNDIASLKNNYTLNIARAEVKQSVLEWGTQISYPTITNNTPYPRPPSPRSLGVLIVRSPDSGQIYTFTSSDEATPVESDVNASTLTNMLVAGNSIPGQGARLICVKSNGLLETEDRGVFIQSFASSSNAIEMRTNDFMTSTGTGMKC